MATPAGVGVAAGVGLAVGFGIGYFVAKARWADHYNNLAQVEIDEARAYYLRAKQAAEAQLKKPLEEVVEYLGYVKPEGYVPPGLEEEGPTDPGTPEEPLEESGSGDPGTPEGAVEVGPEGGSDEMVIPHVDTENHGEVPGPMLGPITGDIWDYAEELAKREADPNLPYIIHVDEFRELQDEGYTNLEFTYYEGDGIVTDERDAPIDNVDELLGLENLQRFGHGTDNPDVLFIRNPVLQEEIEICKAPGSYGEEDATEFLKHQYDVERMPKRHGSFDDD